MPKIQRSPQVATSDPPPTTKRRGKRKQLFPQTPIPTPQPLPSRYGEGKGAKYVCPNCLGVPGWIVGGCGFCDQTGRWGWV